jgi:hypothetical protein
MKPSGFETKARVALWAGLLLASLLAPAGLRAGGTQLDKIPGYVDGTPLIELAGEDALTMEINLSGALLKALTGFDPELKEVAGRLDSIHAVILELEDKATGQRIKELVSATKRSLTRKGWQAVARVREEGSELNILTLADGERIQGLLVLIVDPEEGNVVFANVAGILDLAAIQKLGEELDIPGLDELTDE